MKAILIILFIVGCQQSEVTVKEYKQNEMINGCVMQQTPVGWIKTCG
jgi:PBP1b-binding outer membrane lipoprotein LpoB